METGRQETSQDENLTQQIVEEAERRIQQRAAPPPEHTDDLMRANRVVYWLSRHWIALLNVIIFLYLAGTALAPLFMHLGMPRAARIGYAVYAPFCHQYPFRSFFLFGDSAVHPLREPPTSVVVMNQLRSEVGSPETGYKLALCQRDIAIYIGMLVTGLLYGPIARRWKVKSLPLWLFFVFGFMPVLLDGGIQWLSYAVWQFYRPWMSQPFETIPAMRVLTGALFGIGVIGIGYPEMDAYFKDTVKTLSARYGWKP